MSRRALLLLCLVAIAGGVAWHAKLFDVDRSTRHPRPLARLPEAERRPASFDVVLAAVPSGMHHLQSGKGPTLVHYWAPWERHGRAQALGLDSLQRDSTLAALDVTIVCFDPFPSVARFVGRHRMTVRVLLDRDGALRRQLACPVLPYTYVVDAAGRVLVAQPGEVAWDAPETRRLLREILEEAREAPAPGSGTA